MVFSACLVGFMIGKGYGKLTCPEGTVYEGSWHEGQRSGPGTLKFKVRRHRSTYIPEVAHTDTPGKYTPGVYRLVDASVCIRYVAHHFAH